MSSQYVKEIYAKNDIKFFQETAGGKHFLQLPARGIYGMFQEVCEDAENIRKVCTANPDNACDMFENGTPKNREFMCGKIEDFLKAGKGVVDMSLFLEMREKMRKLSMRIQEELLPLARKRTRTHSSYDGEFSLDRQWELEPFSTTRQEGGGLLPTLNVVADFSLNAYDDPEEIAKYGAFCWAIIDAVEQCGISCKVDLFNKSSMHAFGGGGYRDCTALEVTVNVKEAGEYVDTLSIARCFTASFYRRGILGLKYSTGAYHESSISGGLSQPEVLNEPIASPSKIFLRKNHVTLHAADVAKEILGALRATKN